MRNIMKNAGVIKRYIVLTSLPLVVLVALVLYYFPDMLHWDEWDIFPLVDKFHNNTLTFQDIFAPHNMHRIVWTKIIILLNAIYFHWNLYLEIAVNILLALCISIVIYYSVEKIDKLDTTKRMILYFTSVCLVLSFNQHDNFLHGFQMQIFMSVFFDMLAVSLIVYGGIGGFFGAMAAGFFGTFSFANGLIIWPIGFVLLLLLKYVQKEKISFWKIILWLAVSMLCIYLYLYDMPQSSLSGSVKNMLFRPHMTIILVLSFLGSPLSVQRLSVAIVLGVLGLMLQVCCFVKIASEKNFSKNLFFWCGADMYAVFTALTIAYGRAVHFAASMEVRYITMGVMFWIATIMIFFIAFDSRNKLSAKWYLAAGIVIISFSISENALLSARLYSKCSHIFRQQMEAGIYDNYTFLHYAYPHRRAAHRIPLMRKYGVRHFENAPEVIEFNDFYETNFASDTATNNNTVSYEVENAALIDECFYSINGWWKVDKFMWDDKNMARSYIILRNDTSAFEAELENNTKEMLNPYNITKIAKNSDRLKREYFSCNQLYIGNLPAGKYEVFLKISAKTNYYVPLGQGITIE